MPKAKRRSGKIPKSDRPCTYDLGYVRQDLYACNKCIKEANGTLSGFCRGCKETCHADHEDQVMELYTKRHFRCDCGNSRMRNKCSLTLTKDDLNVENEPCYSHNFKGRYCRCDRKYDYQLAMAQCAMCEDWFHEECYKTDAEKRAKEVAEDDPFMGEYEYTCKECVSILPLLSEYYEVYHAWVNTDSPIKSGRRSKCVRPKQVDVVTKPGTLDYVWRPGFRVALCRCPECMELYRSAGVAYLVDRGDFVGAPEQEDPNLLQATDDTEIIRDVLEAEEAEQEKKKKMKSDDPLDMERIPRKSDSPRGKTEMRDPSQKNDQEDIGQKLSEDQIMAIRARINHFLRNTIETNGGNLNKESMEKYLGDMYTDYVNEFSKNLKS